MKFLEFHFNPKLARKKDLIFDTFCFEPETRKEENLGYLYLIGELKNLLPKNQNLLTNLTEIIKKEYYKPLLRPANQAFKSALSQANEFLAREIKKENVSWLGNLNFTALSITNDFLLNFSKIGNLKILLLREGEIFSIGENLNFESSPTKVFPNLVEGKLTLGDKILIATQEVFLVFDREEIFPNLTKVKKLKEIKKIFKQKKKILKEIFGACLIIIPEKKGVLFKKLYFPKILKISLPFPKTLPLRRLTPLWQRVLPQSPILKTKLKKSLFYILILVILLLLGWLIF